MWSDTKATIAAPVATPRLLRVAEDSEERFPALRMLDLSGISLYGEAFGMLAQALSRLPKLTGLALSAPPRPGLLGQDLLNMLGERGSNGGWILPRVEAFGIQECRDVDAKEVLKVVHARDTIPGLSRIRYLKLTYTNVLESETCDALRRAVETVHIEDSIY